MNTEKYSFCIYFEESVTVFFSNSSHYSCPLNDITIAWILVIPTGLHGQCHAGHIKMSPKITMHRVWRHAAHIMTHVCHKSCSNLHRTRTLTCSFWSSLICNVHVKKEANKFFLARATLTFNLRIIIFKSTIYVDIFFYNKIFLLILVLWTMDKTG